MEGQDQTGDVPEVIHHGLYRRRRRHRRRPEHLVRRREGPLPTGGGGDVRSQQKHVPGI